MMLRLTFGSGRVEVTSGEAPSDLLGALRELAAERPEAAGTAVLVAVPGEDPRAELRGTFGPDFEQEVRNLWGMKSRGYRIPARLGFGPLLFRVSVSGGAVGPVVGDPPELVTRFCQAYARANPDATARVAGVMEESGAELRFEGEIPPHIQERLKRRWWEHEVQVSASATPRRGCRWGRVFGTLLLFGVGLAVLSGQWGVSELHVPSQLPGVRWFAKLSSGGWDFWQWDRRPGGVKGQREPVSQPGAGWSSGAAARATGSPQPTASRPPELEWEAPSARTTDEWPEIIGQIRERRRVAPQDVRLRTALARAHHAYGIGLAERRDWEVAAANVETAVRLAPEEPRYREILGRIFLGGAHELRRELRQGWGGGHSVEKVKHWVEQAIQADPKLAEAYVVLGDLEYENQRLQEASSAWLKARELNPGVPGISTRLRNLSREYGAEVRMKEVQGYDFIVRYEEGVSRSLGSFDLSSLLGEARQLVGQAFDHWPQRRIVVLLYTPETYRRVRSEAPEWSGGLYDGKIRIPVPESRADVANVRHIVTHEYTHAVVDDLTNGRCPRWLNEGLAELQSARYSRGNWLAGVQQAARRGHLTPWKNLDLSFRSPSGTRARQSYDEAHSIVAYLDKNHGFWRIREVLVALAAGSDVGAAFYQSFHLSLEELEHSWRRWLGRSG